MPNYRRAWIPGGTYFFTVNLLRRRGNPLLVLHIDALRRAVIQVRRRHPFTVHGWIVLPDHLHCILELPPGDADFALRWRLIKLGFSKALPRGSSAAPMFASDGVSVASGNGDSGNMSSGTMRITHRIWITFTPIRSSTDWWNASEIGRIPRSTAWWNEGFILWIGWAAMRQVDRMAMIEMRRNALRLLRPTSLCRYAICRVNV